MPLIYWESLFPLSSNEIETGLHITDVLFHTRLSKMAAEAFLAWFLGRSGRASKEEVADFADSLASGTAGSRLSKSSFYGGVLRKFLDAGLIALIPEFDYGKRRAGQGLQKRRAARTQKTASEAFAAIQQPSHSRAVEQGNENLREEQFLLFVNREVCLITGRISSVDLEWIVLGLHVRLSKKM